MKKKHTRFCCHHGCPVEATLQMIGGKWKGILLYHLMDAQKPLRFGQLLQAVGTVTRPVMTRQLKEMIRDGLVTREVFPVVPPRVEYALSDKGRTLIPVLLALKEWGETYGPAQGLTKDEVEDCSAD